MQQISYCRRWNDICRKPIEPLDEAEAARRDAEGEEYAVVVGDGAAPEAVIEVVWKNEYVGVWFFDEQRRRDLNYAFRRIEPDRLFLHEIVTWTYPPEAETFSDATIIDTLVYQHDGVVRHDHTDTEAKEVESTHYKDVSLDTNWEPVPRFGDWASVARRNRQETPQTT
jgi:hypothetical protein